MTRLQAAVPLLLALLLPLQEPSPTPPSAPFRSSIVSESAGVEQLELKEGTRLRSQPDPRAVAIAMLDADMAVRVLERRDGWALVSWDGLKGWVLLGEETPASAVAGGAPQRAPGPDPRRLAEARRLLGKQARSLSLGPYTLLTDLRDETFLETLSKAAVSVEEAYRSRFGVDAPSPRGEVVVLFARESAYRSFERSEPSIAGLEAAGHAGGGIAALRSEGVDRDELRGVLVHELTHLLNRRSGLTLPAWLEEGMAEDLGYCRFDGEGRLLPGTLRARLASEERTVPGAGGGLTRFTRVSLTGPQAAVNDAVEGLGRRETPVKDLLEMPWRTLVAQGNRARTYPLSALLLRYLLDGEKGRYAAGLRLFLSSGASSSDALLTALEPDPERRATLTAELESGFSAWLPKQRLALGH